MIFDFTAESTDEIVYAEGSSGGYFRPSPRTGGQLRVTVAGLMTPAQAKRLWDLLERMSKGEHGEREERSQAKESRQRAVNDFVGFVEEWRSVLGFAPRAPVTRAEVEAAYRKLAKAAHPDRPGGSHEAMTRLNQARETALQLAI